MSINSQLNNNLLFCIDGYVHHNLFSVRNIFRKCSLCRTRKFRWWSKMVKCRECNLICHSKCFSKLAYENMNATVVQNALPATEEPNAIRFTDHQQLTEQRVRRMNEIPSVDATGGYKIAVFLQQHLLMLVDYSELVARVRAAKYAQRPYPVVKRIDRKYVPRGREIHLVTKFEMDDGDEYYVITICYDYCGYTNRYIGKTIYIYGQSSLHETARVLNRLWNRPHLVRIQSATNSGYS